jgi:hypothetical protein
MITKKWVEEKLEAVRQTQDGIDKRVAGAESELGKEKRTEMVNMPLWGNVPCASWRYPTLSVLQKIDAICAYLSIEIVKEEKAENIVAKKIKK